MRSIVTIVVLAVGGLIAGGTLLVFIGRWRADAERIRCADNLRRICQLYLLDEAQKTRAYPAGTVKIDNLPPEQRLSWIAPGLTRLGHQELTVSIDFKKPWDWEANKTAGQKRLKHLICPAISEIGPPDGMAPLDYPGIAGVGSEAAMKQADAPGAGMFRYDGATLGSDVKDGLANALMLLETSRRPGPWIAGGPPTVRSLDPGERPYIGLGKQFGGNHPGGANASMADGSGRFINQGISSRVLELLAGIADGDLPDNSQ